MIVVVLHEPQDLVNIAHVVRALKNFALRDLRLVRPREYDAYRVEGIAHQTQDVLARVAPFDRLRTRCSTACTWWASRREAAPRSGICSARGKRPPRFWRARKSARSRCSSGGRTRGYPMKRSIAATAW